MEDELNGWRKDAEKRRMQKALWDLLFNVILLVVTLAFWTWVFTMLFKLLT